MLRTKSSQLCTQALKDAAGPGIDTVSVQAAATTAPQQVLLMSGRSRKGLGIGKFWVTNETNYFFCLSRISHNSPTSLYSKATPR